MTDWLMVIITAVYVVATIVICIFNGIMAAAAKKQTETAKQQIEEMIRQYNESHRPFVIISFETIRNGLHCFKIENIGPVAATNIKIRINDEFLDNLEKVTQMTHLRRTIEATLLLISHQKEYILLGLPGHFAQIATVPAKFDISYNEKYEEHMEIDLMQFQYMLLYKPELGEISEHLNNIEIETKIFHDKLIDVISKRRP